LLDDHRDEGHDVDPFVQLIGCVSLERHASMCRNHSVALVRSLVMDVSREILLPVDRETAWEAVTDLDRWLTAGGSLDLEPGAEGELTLPDGEVRWATVEDVRPGELLSFWWHGDGALATLVELTLVNADAGAATRVLVVERGYAGTPICGSPWAGGAQGGPRALSAAAGTASPSYPLGSAWIVSGLDWEPALARLRDSFDLVAA
jgi:uncharacterized protein YndB with AHSA1/START domain